LKLAKCPLEAAELTWQIIESKAVCLRHEVKLFLLRVKVPLGWVIGACLRHEPGLVDLDTDDEDLIGDDGEWSTDEEDGAYFHNDHHDHDESDFDDDPEDDDDISV
jgi:hypothetical protein